MNFLLLRMGGTQAVSVYGILMYADGFVQPLLYGMCDSLQPAVGYNLGAGNRGRIRSIEKCCYTASAAVSLLSAAVLFFFTDIVIRMFVSEPDAGFMEMAHTAVRLFCLYLYYPVVFLCHTELYGSCGQTERGGGDITCHSFNFSGDPDRASVASGA